MISKFLTKGKTQCDSNFIRQLQEILIKMEETVRLFLNGILNTPATLETSFDNDFIGNSVLTFMFCFKTLYVTSFLRDDVLFSCYHIHVPLSACLASKRCSSSGLNCRYLTPVSHWQKLIGLAIKLYQELSNKIDPTISKCERPNHLLKAVSVLLPSNLESS